MSVTKNMSDTVTKNLLSSTHSYIVKVYIIIKYILFPLYVTYHDDCLSIEILYSLIKGMYKQYQSFLD